MPERLKWRLAYLVNRLPGQCWADLVSWALRSPKHDPGLRAALPWRPITGLCRRDAAECGRCYCGKIAADGTELRYGESVCVTRMPGRDDRLCSRPHGHDGMHRCGGVEWSRV